MRPENILKRAGVLLLCAALIATSACTKPAGASSDNGGNDSNGIKAMGRYLESDVQKPEGLDVGALKQLPNGQVLVQMNGQDNATKIYKYDGISFTPYGDVNYQEVAKTVIEGGSYTVAETFDVDGNFYQLIDPFTDSNIGDNVMVKVDTSGDASIIDMDWQLGENGRLSISGLTADSKGNLIAYQHRQGLYRYSPDGEFMDSYITDVVGSFVVCGEDVAIIDNALGALVIYNMESQSVVSSIPVESMGTDGILTIGDDNTLYNVNSFGLFKYVKGGSVIEKIADGELYSLSIPSLTIYGAAYLNGEFIINFSDMSTYESKLIKMSYSVDTPSKPDIELTVYSLYEDSTVRQAVGEFQRNNPDVKVNVQTPMGSKVYFISIIFNGMNMFQQVDNDNPGSASEEDVIRSLNTELLNGKGPDVIILDGLPADSYEEKGVLADISDLIEPMISSGQLLKNIASSCDRGDGIYMVPARFRLPVLITDNDKSEMAQNLESLAKYAAEHKDMPTLKKYTPSQLLEAFYLTSQPEILKDKAIDRDALIKYLSYLKDIYDTSWPDGTLDDQVLSARDKNHMSLLDWHGGKAHAAMDLMKGFKGVVQLSVINQHDDALVTSLPGMAEDIFEPVCMASINAKSDKPDLAKAFIETLLSYNVQSSDLDTGFPINLKIYDEKAALDEPDESAMWYTESSDSDDNNIAIEGNDPSGKDLEPIISLCKNAHVPVVVDSTLLGIITDKTEAFFDGSMTAEEAADAVIEEAWLYLGE